MATSPFRRSNSDVPGTSGYHYYGPHDYEHLMVWRPSGSFTGKPLVVFIHGGLGYNPGNRAVAVDDPGGNGVCTELHTQHGWPVVSLEYPPCPSNAVPRQEVCNTAVWPSQLYSVARAIQYLKANADGTTEHGATLWGTGNSIDPGQIVIVGDSWGGTLAMLLALVPDGALPVAGGLPLGFPNYAQEHSHKPRAVVSINGQSDWTQFCFEGSGTAALGSVYANNIHQAFMYANQGTVWGPQYNPADPTTPTNPANQLPLRIKKDASPWWWLVRADPAARNVAFYLKWPSTAPSSTFGQSLTPEDWSPGTPRWNEGAGKAFLDPHHRFQAYPTAAEMQRQGIPVRTVWGTTASNPSGTNIAGWNVNQDTVDAAYANSTREDMRRTLVETWGIQ